MFSIKANYNGPYSVTTSVDSCSYTIKTGQHVVIKDNSGTIKSDSVPQKENLKQQKKLS